MIIDLSMGFISFAISTALYSLILLISLFSLHKHKRGKLFLLLASAILVWGFILTLSQIGESIPFKMVFMAELLRYFAWFYILQQASGYYQAALPQRKMIKLVYPLSLLMLMAIAVLTTVFDAQLNIFLHITNPNEIHIIWVIAFSIIGLILVEHLLRNTARENKDDIIYLCISAGAIFCYDLFVFSNALLLNQIDYEYWSARGIVNVLIIPTLIIAAVRNPTLAPRLHVSREFVFHSATLIGTGIYLILMSIAGYVIKQKGGEWGGVLQASFLFTTLVLLFSIFFSSSLKLRLKRFLGRSFRNKYDYRGEWNRFSNTLFTHSTDYSIFKRAIIATAQILGSQGGTLWLQDSNLYQCVAGWKTNTGRLTPIDKDASLINYIHFKKTLFTISEYLKKNDASSNPSFSADSDNWLILPLWNNKVLFGFICLKKAPVYTELDIEDYDLLETVAHHISLSLSLNDTLSALQQAEKFKSINQMTAFLTHDLKTLLSQLFLLVENGKVHKDNPAFIDDMLDTLDHVSRKMQRLVNQLKDPAEKAPETIVSIPEILDEILNDYKHSAVQPAITKPPAADFRVLAGKTELCSALKHIIQNAVDSVDGDGWVKIELASNNSSTLSIKIIDNGKGMTQEFIANRLFQPFESTKGVSGMGIGVYQSREYIRSLQGDIQVASPPGKGTTFTITLPLNNKTA